MTDEDRTAWLAAIGWQLRSLPREDVDRQSKRWMPTYVQRRIDTIPRLLTQSEASAIAEWVVQLGDSFDDGVRLLGRTQASLNDQRMLLLDLNVRMLTPSRSRLRSS